MRKVNDSLNVLLITSNQQHWDTLGATNPRIRTPALDRLASEGARFERAYCNNPVCSPSRATIITGLYPSWHGCWTIGVKLAEDVPTVGEWPERNVVLCHILPTPMDRSPTEPAGLTR